MNLGERKFQESRSATPHRRSIALLSMVLMILTGTTAWAEDPLLERTRTQVSGQDVDLGLEPEDLGLSENGVDWLSCMESTGMGVVAAATGTACAAICLAEPMSAPACAGCLGVLAGEGVLGGRRLFHALDQCEDYLLTVVPDIVPGRPAISCDDQDWHYSIDYYPFRGYYEELDDYPYTNDGGFHPGNPGLIPEEFCAGSIEVNLYNYCRNDLVDDNLDCVARCIDTFLDEARAHCRRFN